MRALGVDGRDNISTARYVSGGSTWAIVLAAGEGSRLRSLTTNDEGVGVPKQFCSLRDGPSLLNAALRRSATLAPRAHRCVVVAAEHRRWWRNDLATLPLTNIIVQPDNRGTTNGILLALCHILERDPEARIVLLPADHFVRDESILADALADADFASATGDEIVLLGMAPEEPDSQLGYIVPGEPSSHGTSKVHKFVEKPAERDAMALVSAGALWNTFILTAKARTLLNTCRRRHGASVDHMLAALRADRFRHTRRGALSQLYRNLPTADFSRDIATTLPDALAVKRVPPCGWSDLGTPERVAKTLASMTARTSRPPSRIGHEVALSLEQRLAQWSHSLSIRREIRREPSVTLTPAQVL